MDFGFPLTLNLASPDVATEAARNDQSMSLHTEYIAAKAAWLIANPGATPEQYEAACQAIAERLGV